MTAKASVMIYDDVTKKWKPSGSGEGLSRVQIYQNLMSQSYRIVGRKIIDHEVVINSTILKGLKYNQANQTFLQWRDKQVVYGLNFPSKEEADAFAHVVKLAVDNLNRLASGVAASAAVVNANTNPSANSSCNSGKNLPFTHFELFHG
jgi:enabled protein